MSAFANELSGAGFAQNAQSAQQGVQGIQQGVQQFNAHNQVTQASAGNHAGGAGAGSAKDYFGAQDKVQNQIQGFQGQGQGQGYGQEAGHGGQNMGGQNMAGMAGVAGAAGIAGQNGQQFQGQQYGAPPAQGQQYGQQYGQTSDNTNANTNHMNNGNNQTGGAQQGLGAGEPAQAAQQDTLHKLLDRIEKKFGGERFNNPDNVEKNKKLNDSLVLKLQQVMKVVMTNGPNMIMRLVR